MKLEFTWVTGPAGPQATCTVQDASSTDICPLACLLMDDGGLDTSTSLEWLREGVARVDAALSGRKKSRTVDWDREAWGSAVTEVEMFRVRVYTLINTVNRAVTTIPLDKVNNHFSDRIIIYYE
jgi:hypothetical protein